MKTIDEIKDEVADECCGYDDFHDMTNGDKAINLSVNEIVTRYAEQAIRECAERAKLTVRNVVGKSGMVVAKVPEVDKASILSLIKELK